MVYGLRMCIMINLCSKVLFMLVFVMTVTLYNYAFISPTQSNTTVEKEQNVNVQTYWVRVPPPGYLVWSPNCQIPDIGSKTGSGSRIFPMSYLKNTSMCSEDLPLTNAIFDLNTRRYSLHIDEEFEKDGDSVTCCYVPFSRSTTAVHFDEDDELERCVQFVQDEVLSVDVDGVVVISKSKQNGEEVQRNAHLLVQERPEIRKQLKTYSTLPNRSHPISVLMLGIGGVSRFRLRKVLPNTTNFLLKMKWFDLSGYNKVEDNDFPNLMAILAGYRNDTASKLCNLHTPGGLHNCKLIWDKFRQSGYVTAFGEDHAWMDTFSYKLRSLKEPPVDYYLSPLLLAIEKSLFRPETNAHMAFCIGHRHAAEHVFDQALEVATHYRSQPYFGLFWVNTLSRELFDAPAIVDIFVLRYLDEMASRGILEDAVVILFSDRGSGIGNVMTPRQSLLDERLPFIFIWLPPWLRAKYPEFVVALNQNRYRLTSPYDIHMTLKHILELSGRVEKLPSAEGCPHCQSVLKPFSSERSCKDIGIGERWCTCSRHQNVAAEPKAHIAVTKVLNEINKFLRLRFLIPPCSFLSLRSIDDVQKQVKMKSDEDQSFGTEVLRLIFTANPRNARFEATVAVSNVKKPEIVGTVYRLDSYARTSDCVLNKILKKFCVCGIKN